MFKQTACTATMALNLSVRADVTLLAPPNTFPLTRRHLGLEVSVGCHRYLFNTQGRNRSTSALPFPVTNGIFKYEAAGHLL